MDEGIEAEEIANMVAFLASLLSAATKDAAFRVEGGLINSLAQRQHGGVRDE